jgi:hypothetical protein
MFRFGIVGSASKAAPWLAIAAMVLLVPGAVGGPTAHGQATAPSVGTLHAWVSITNHSGTPPAARQAYGMAYDPILGVTLLFGGNSAAGFALGDTWEFVGGLWKNLNLTGSAAPPARWSEGLVYDPALGGIVMFGGQSGYISSCGIACAFNDTWLFNGTGWHNLNLTVAPSPQAAPGLVYDSHDGYGLLVSDPVGMPTYTEEWRFVGATWVNDTATMKGALPNRGFVQADDAADGYVLMFGGSSGCNGLGLTWMYRNGTFHNLTSRQTATPAAVDGSRAISYDPRVRGVVMTGGYSNACHVSNQTWLFHRGLWVNVSTQTGTAIPGRWDARMVWDLKIGPHGGDLTFSGNEALVGGSNHFGSDTWKLVP